MSRELSIYLDLLRFLAAVAVMLSHVSSQSFSGGFLWPCTRLGVPAVIVFFVLSGYVIGHSVAQPGRTARSYIIARGARLYSVVLPALLLTILLDGIGMHSDARVYAGFVPVLAEAWSLPLVLLFLNEAWGGFEGIGLGSNGPYWSLGYEAPFYLLFGIAWYRRGRTRLLLLALAGLVAGPIVLVMFPMWLLGFALFRSGNALVPTPRMGLWMVGTTALAVAAILASHEAAVDLADHRGSEIVTDYAIALLFLVHLAGFTGLAPRLAPLLMRVEKPVRWLAGGTFTLYLLHQPVATCFKALSPWSADSPWFRAGMILLPFVLCYAVAGVTERRAHAWRARIQTGLRWLRHTWAGTLVFPPLLRALR